jgi:hypothetical protein
VRPFRPIAGLLLRSPVLLALVSSFSAFARLPSSKPSPAHVVHLIKCNDLTLLFAASTGAAGVNPLIPRGSQVVLHLDASTLSPGLLPLWPDLSGNGFNAVQSSATFQPTVVSNVRYCSAGVRYLGTAVLTIPNNQLLNPENEV